MVRLQAMYPLLWQEFYHKMKQIISKIIQIKTDKLPPSVDFIELEIRKNKIEPVRWAIVECKNNILTVSISGYEI